VQVGELTIEGVTAEHPFWCPRRGSWVPIGELREGEQVLCWLGAADAGERPITSIEIITHVDDVEVYTLSVEGEHNYFAESVLVHNKMGGIALIDVVDVACEDDRLVLRMETIDVPTRGVFNLWETGSADGWNEEHELPIVDSSPHEWWSNFEVALEHSVVPADLVSGQNTVFQCGVHDVQPVMTFMARIYQFNDTTLADCWIWTTHEGGIEQVKSGEASSPQPITDAADVLGCTER